MKKVEEAGGWTRGKAMSPAQYDKFEAAKNRVKQELKDTIIAPDEAIDALLSLGFGRDNAIKLVDEWGKGHFTPHSVWSKIKVESSTARIKPGKYLLEGEIPIQITKKSGLAQDLASRLIAKIVSILADEYGWNKRAATEEAKKFVQRDLDAYAYEIKKHYKGDITPVAEGLAADIDDERSRESNEYLESKKIQETTRLVYQSLGQVAESILTEFNLSHLIDEDGNVNAEGIPVEAVEAFRDRALEDRLVSDSQIKQYGGWLKVLVRAISFI